MISGLILAGLGAGMAGHGESLSEAMASAYASNPTLLGERARLRSVDELVPQALSNWRPTVSLSGNATRSTSTEYINGGTAVRSSQSGTTGTGTTLTPTSPGSLIYNNETMGVTVTQPIYRGGRTGAQTRQAEAQVAAERAQLLVTEQQVLLNTVTVYMALVQAYAVLQLSTNNEQVLQRQLDSVQDRFRVGEVTRTDVAQAQSRLSAAHADRTQAEGGLRTARANYLQVVGHAPDQPATPVTLPPVPASAEAARAAASANPSIDYARQSYQAALAGVDLIEGELLPTVSLTGTATRLINFDGPSSLENVAQAIVTVTVPLYQQGQEYSRIRAQKETVSQQRAALDQADRDVEEATTAAWEALQTGHARRVSYADQIKAAEVALEGVQRESQVGSRTVLDVLNAEQELLNAQVNEVQATHDEVVATYQLLSATGQLNANTLELPVDRYDPTLHYEDVHDKWVGFGDGLKPDSRVQ